MNLLNTMMKILVLVYTGMEEFEGSPDSFVRAYTQEKLIDDSQFGDTIVFVLADLVTNIDPIMGSSSYPEEVQASRKVAKKKLRHQWAYENPLNRIHGFLIIKELPMLSTLRLQCA